MPKPVAEVGEGHEDASGNGVYCFIRDLIVEGRDARFVDKKGRYLINWSRALKCYHDYKSKRNPQYKSKNINRRKASNGLRAALLNFYKKEGAKEYKDCKKVNENDEVVERQFQMPPRVFESLFGSNVQLPDDSSEHETSSITSEADEKPLTTPDSSDTGFDEAMDVSDDLFNTNEEPSSHCALGGLPAGDPLCSNVKTEEDQVDPSDITGPCQMFDISEEELDLVLGEICSNSDTNDIDLLGVVHDICPSSGSVKGGMQFYISLTEELSEDDKSGIAHFDGIGDVYLKRLNCYTLAGTIPASQQPGPVSVTVNTQDDRLLGMTYFMYVDEIQEVLKQIVKDPALQALYLTMWSQEHGFFGSDINLDPSTLQDQGSSIQGTHAQALKGLQLLVYTAAQTNAQQFIQMIFSTSAGRLVFNAYKDRPQLPEDVARANGHDDLAQYLQDVNARLTKENSNNAQPSSMDWLQLIEAVNKIQKKSSVIEDETDLEAGQSKDDDDHESDYFADVETSSCGSFELEIGWSDSEDREGPCSKEGGSDKEPDVKSASSMNVMPCNACTCSEVETQSDNDLDLKDDKNSEEGEVKEVCDIGYFGQQIGVATQKRESTTEREHEARAYLHVDQEKCMQLKNPFTKDERPKKEPDERLTPCMEGTSSEAPTVLGTNLDNELDQKADGKNDRNLGTTEVGKSSMISQLSKKVAERRQSGREEEASTVPSQEKTTKPKRTAKWLKGDAVTTSSRQGACVNETEEVPSFRERSYQGVTGGGTQDRENINDRKEDSTAGPSQAKRHKQRTQWRPFRRTLLKSFFLLTIAVITVLCLAAGIKLRERQLLYWAVRNGHIRISQALLNFVSDVDAPHFCGETPLHLAAKNGYTDLAELLMKLGSNVNSEDYQQRTPLHLAAWSGCQGMANALIRYGSDVNAGDDSQQTPLHLAAWSGCQEIANALVRHGSDVNARDDSLRTPLHLAAWSGCQEIANALVRHGSDVNARDDSLRTPLHLAALNGHRNVLQVLIQSGSDVNDEERFGWTPLHLAASSGHKEIGEILVQHGSVINIRNNVLGCTPLHLAAMNGHLQMVQFLTQRGSDVKARFALHLAAGFGHKQIVDLLIHHGSNVIAGNICRGTLHSAVNNFRRNIAEVLIQNVNARDIFGQTPLHLAARSGDQEITEFLIQQRSELKAQDNFQQTALHLAAQNGHRNVAEVLIRYGSNVNARDFFGQTPLHLAIRRGDQEIAEFLIQQGSELKAQDNSQQAPLHLAARNGQKNITEILRFGSNLKARNKFGETPLQITEFLLPHGSEPKTQYDLQQTSLQLGAQNRHRNVAEVLILCVSDANVRNKYGDHQRHLLFLPLAVRGGHREFLNHTFISDVNARDGFQKFIHYTADNLKQTRYKFYPRDASVIWPDTLLKRFENGTSLKQLIEASQASSDLIHWESRPFHTPFNLFIRLRDDFSGPRDHKLKLDKPSVTQCLSISLGREERINHSINPGIDINYSSSTEQNLAHQGLRSKYTSLIDRPTCILCSTKLASNGRPKDKDGNKAKISHSFGSVDKSIKNGTNKVLIRSELPVKEISHEGNHLVIQPDAKLLLLVITSLTLHITILLLILHIKYWLSSSIQSLHVAVRTSRVHM